MPKSSLTPDKRVRRADIHDDIQALRALLQDPEVLADDKALDRLALSLARHEQAGGVDEMIALADSRLPQIRRTAVKTLWDRKERRGIPVFLRALEDEDHAVRMWGIYGLRDVGDVEDDRGLLAATRSADDDVRLAATRGLPITPQCLERLVELADDKNWRVRWFARRRLRNAQNNGG